jgi:glycosyltransferase involved in cell wall biosynthesis
LLAEVVVQVLICRAFRAAIFVLVLPLDIALGLLLAVALCIEVARLRLSDWRHGWRQANRERIRVLRLIEGGHLEDIYHKFKTLETYKNAHVIDDYTDLIIGSIFPSSNNFRIRLEKRYILVETAFFPRAALSSAFYLLLRHVRLVRENRLDLLHANSPYLQGLVALLLAKMTRRPWVTSIHADYDKSRALQPDMAIRVFGSVRLAECCRQVVYRHAPLLLPIREYLRLSLIQVGADPDRLRVFPHGINLDAYLETATSDVLSQLGVNGQDHIISSVARMELENYCDDLLAIALAVVAAHPTAIVVLAGDGSQLPRLRAEVERNGVSARVHLPGAIPHGLVPALRQQSTVSLCLMGGFSLIEACAAASPVIAYDVEWHSELVVDGVTGYLVAEGATEEVAGRILDLLAAPEAAREMGLRARQRAIARHSMTETNRVKVSIYKEAMGGA